MNIPPKALTSIPNSPSSTFSTSSPTPMNNTLPTDIPTPLLTPAMTYMPILDKTSKDISFFSSDPYRN